MSRARALDQLSDHEWVRYLVEKAQAMTPDEMFQLSVRAGIYTPQGQLTPEYGGPEPVTASVKRARPAHRKAAPKKASTKRSARTAAR